MSGARVGVRGPGSSLEKLLQLTLNGLMAGAVLAVPAIGFTMIYPGLRFLEFSVAPPLAGRGIPRHNLHTRARLPANGAGLGALLPGAPGRDAPHPTPPP